MLKKLGHYLYCGLWLAGIVALFLALLSYTPLDNSLNTATGQDMLVHNYLGTAGAYVADILYQTFGFASWLLVCFGALHFIWLCRNQEMAGCWLRRWAGFGAMILMSFLLSFSDQGGFVGSLIYRALPMVPSVLAVLLWAACLALLVWVMRLPVVKWSKLAYFYANVFVERFVLKRAEVKLEKPVFKAPEVKKKAPEEKKKAKKAAAKPVPSVAKPVKSADGFVLPPVDLLDEPKTQSKEVLTREMMEHISRQIETVLAQFHVKGEVVRVCPGPVITLYEFEPAAGIKASRVISFADDLARAMSVVSVRMAVVPGSSVIGIELPNKVRQTVYIKEIMSCAPFQNCTGALPIILGKNIAGTPFFDDLAKMPHLLVAGTTGSGKSVGINTMILSLLYRFTPSQCKLIMVDPKMLELSVYNGIPHLLTPVVTEPGKAVVALKWAVKEMDDRYRQMATLGVRNIEGYNKKINETIAAGKTLTRQVQTGFDPETGRPIIETQEMELSLMPYIVIIVDEMADLMLTAGKEIEVAVNRIAAKARASGIHMIMATQRPSVDVITGTIKANFPSRISFQVTSKFDSVTIIGDKGAEQLLGRGDMLYVPAGKKPIRLHGPFVNDDEVERVVEYLKSQGEAQYNEAVTIDEEEGALDEGAVFDNTAMGSSGQDLYEQAVQIVMANKDKKPSISFLQRKLSIGYNRAADLIDRMENEGIVSKASPTGRRELLIGGDNK